MNEWKDARRNSNGLSITKSSILSSNFNFPEIMLNNITCEVHDTEALCPEYKVVSCRILKAKKAHTRRAGEVNLNA